VRFQPHFKLYFEGSSEQQLFLSYSLRTQLKPLRQELVCGLIAERPVNAGRLRPSSEPAEVGTGSHLSANPTYRELAEAGSITDPALSQVLLDKSICGQHSGRTHG